MKKKPPVLRSPQPMAETDDRSWHNGGDIEIMMYARSLHRTAMNLVASLDMKPYPKTAWDACPVVLLYRQSVELYLKTLVDEGGNFLKERTDSITLAKTHSLRWLAQIVCQIIKAVRWESEFKCEGVSSLADFSALMSELEELDPVWVLVRPGNRRSDGSVPPQLLPPNLGRLAKKLDALIDLLDAIADGLAAKSDQHADLLAPGNPPPTIQ